MAVVLVMVVVVVVVMVKLLRHRRAGPADRHTFRVRPRGEDPSQISQSGTGGGGGPGGMGGSWERTGDDVSGTGAGSVGAGAACRVGL